MHDAMAIIPLRAGSKGLPGKNVRPIAGKPLYRHALDQAMQVIGQCVISTDIAEVLNARFPKGCRVVPRPAHLAGDDTPMAPVLKHLFEQLGDLPQTAVLLQATSPLRRNEDIQRALELFNEGDFELVMSVVRTDPSILKYGFADQSRFTPISDPDYCFANRQSLPQIVRPNGAVYVFSPHRFMETGSLVSRSIGSIEMPKSHSIDIDTPADLNAVETLLLERAFSKAS